MKERVSFAIAKLKPQLTSPKSTYSSKTAVPEYECLQQHRLLSRFWASEGNPDEMSLLNLILYQSFKKVMQWKNFKYSSFYNQDFTGNMREPRVYWTGRLMCWWELLHYPNRRALPSTGYISASLYKSLRCGGSTIPGCCSRLPSSSSFPLYEHLIS